MDKISCSLKYIVFNLIILLIWELMPKEVGLLVEILYSESEAG